MNFYTGLVLSSFAAARVLTFSGTGDINIFIMKYDKNNPTHRLALAGLFTGFILLLTIVVVVPMPYASGAYMNFGDIGCYLAALILGSPWGVLCAAVGSALADIFLGSALYAAPTFIIKGLAAFLTAFFYKRAKKLNLLIILACSGIVMPIGYFVFESIIMGPATALLGVGGNTLQYAVNTLLGFAAARIALRYFEKELP